MQQASSVVVVLGVVALAVVGGLWAQTPQTPEQSLQQFNQIIDLMVDYTSDIEFAERDIESVLRLWSELEEIGLDEEVDEDGIPDFDEILAHPKFRSWAAGHSLDAEDWYRKSMRIQLMTMRAQMSASAAMMQGQMAQQEAMIEEQCAQVGEEMCKQMRQGLEAMAAFGKAWERIPAPTSAEAELLEKYQGQLMGLMQSEDEDEDYGDW